MEYTILTLHKWSKYGGDIKETFHNHNLKWNSTKILTLNSENLKNTLEKFQLTNNEIDIDEKNIASSGIWENEDSSVTIKIIKIENNDDVILIHKGVEKEFYIEFLKKCKDICPLIRKIVGNKITFEKRTNIGLIEKLNNEDEEKKVKIKNFNIKTELMGEFSDKFKKKWIECIENS
jgi:hypothetical protein